jgi:hypothetical protein
MENMYNFQEEKTDMEIISQVKILYYLLEGSKKLEAEN